MRISSSQDSDLAISVRNLSKAYRIVKNEDRPATVAQALAGRLRKPLAKADVETFWALNDVSFELKRGAVVGIIGRNGAGKSTLLKVLSRITRPTSGEIDIYGRVGSLLEVGTGFHPDLTGHENIYLNGAILGMTRREIEAAFDEIVDFAGVEQFLNTPVKRYSSGMYVRLAFAVAAHLNPEVMIVDEVLAVGDAEFQRKCLGKMQDVARSGRTVLFVSHHMQSVSVLCNQAIFMKNGTIDYQGTVPGAIERYMQTFARNANGMNFVDRRGSGEYRYDYFAPVREYFRPDEPKEFDFRVVKNGDQVGKYFLSAHVVNASGVTIAQYDSQLVGRWFDDADIRNGKLSFSTPWLKPGQYSMDVYVCANGILDVVESACSFTVSDVLPYPSTAPAEAISFGLVFGDYDWSENNSAD